MAQIHARAFDGQARAWSAAEFDALLGAEGVVVVGDARGFALSRLVLDEAELLTLATDPACQRQGVARAVLTDIEGRLRARGAVRQFLEVAAGNAPARALYERLGYARIAQRQGYFRLPGGGRDDAVILEKMLA